LSFGTKTEEAVGRL